MYRVKWVIIFLFLSSLSLAQTSVSPTLFPVFSTENKYGYSDHQQNVIIEPQFDKALPFNGNYAYVSENNRWGLINSKGKMVIPAVYENLGWSNSKEIAPEVSEEVIAYQQNGKWGLLTVKNKIITEPIYLSLDFLGSDKIKAGSLSDPQSVPVYSIINTKGKEIVDLKNHFVELLPLSDKILVGQMLASIAGNEKVQYVYAYGIKNWNNETIIPLHYKQITEKGNNQFQVLSFNEYKIMSPSGETIIRADSLYPVFANVYAAEMNGLKGYIKTGESRLQASMQEIQPAYLGLSVFKKENKYGIASLNSKNQLFNFLPPVYDSLKIDSTGFIRAGKLADQTWQWELLAKSNTGEKIVISQQPYDAIHTMKPGAFIQVMKNKKYGYIDLEGNEVIPLEFDKLGTFSDSLCVAVYQGKYGVINKTGKWHFQPAYDNYSLNQFGHAIRKGKDQYEVVDLQGKKKYSTSIPLRFLPDGSIEIDQKDKQGRLSPTGVPCIPAVYDSISPMTTDQTFWAYKGKEIFLYNASGNMLIKQGDLLKDLHYERSSFAPVKIKGKYGYVDSFGRLRITNQYEAAHPFSEGLAAVKFIGIGKWGYLNQEDKIIVQPYYDEVLPFENGVAIVKKGQKYGLIDAKGKELSAFAYDQITRHATGLFVTSVNAKKGLLSTKGNELIYAKYQQLYPQTDGTVVVKLANKYGLVSQNGVSIFPSQYDQVITNSQSDTHILVINSKYFDIKPSNNSPQ